MPSIDPKTGKRFSGAAQQKLKTARAGRPPKETPEAIEAERAFCQRLADLGLPPSDPIATIVWANRVAALVTHSAATDVESERLSVRRRAVLEGVRALGLTNSKAVDKHLMLQIAEKLGIKAKDADADLEHVEQGGKSLRA